LSDMLRRSARVTKCGCKARSHGMRVGPVAMLGLSRSP
jgi:hypothetical protein